MFSILILKKLVTYQIAIAHANSKYTKSTYINRPHNHPNTLNPTRALVNYPSNL
jgi:hypothetical protein